MTESHPEQRPLLCDEYSDEELHLHDTNSKFHRRFRHSFSSGRARTHAIGAAAIITRWPDHLSTLLTYWWIGFGMIAVTVFIMYNSIVAIAMLPPTHNNKPLNTQGSKLTIENKTHKNSDAPNVYMHVFVSNYDEFNVNNYLRYVDAMAKKYIHFKYNFIVVSNDVTQDIPDLNDEQKNEMALNSLWEYNENSGKRKQYETFSVKFISVTKYLDDSPLKKYWRLLPHQFIGFLARAISIWDKGGVAFNPLILTPNTPNPVYLEKLYNILGNFQSKNKLRSGRKRKMTKISKRKLNNIRDIIYNLENGDSDANNFPDSLSEAENIQTITIKPIKAKRNASIFSFNQYSHNSAINMTMQEISVLHKKNSESENSSVSRQFDEYFKPTTSTPKTITGKPNLLANFFELLFQMNSKSSTSMSQNLAGSTTDTTLSKHAYLPSSKENGTLSNETIPKIAPTFYTAPNVRSEIQPTTKSFGGNGCSKLVIDLKGNLVSTDTACHAFIGTVFSNVLHHNDEESLTDFIITELALFCKGNLSTCDGVEVILL